MPFTNTSKKILIPDHQIRVYPASLSTQSFGRLNVSARTTGFSPVENALVRISYPDDPTREVEEVRTDASGQATDIELLAPNVEYSLEPNSVVQPYSNYVINITAPGYEEVNVNGTEILADVTALQNITMLPSSPDITGDAELFVIPPHTLFYDYPPKIAEDEVKPVNESGEIVLNEVVIPEYVVVHDGPPTDNSAQNYYERFRDYIKNVASSEIYATWPVATIYANVLAILSFTLNRVYTEWYRNRGYNFTITSSTAYDHKWIPGRNYFDTISEAVDNLFVNYLSRPGIKQPILTQYCDGVRVSCPNWMTQWGSKNLGDQGYTPIQILRYFYGENMYINVANEVSGVPSSWPGYELTVGSSGQPVLTIQQQLNRISDNYPLIPKLVEDGSFGTRTGDAVRTFQNIFNLPQTGNVDFRTWYQISGIYVAVARLAELV